MRIKRLLTLAVLSTTVLACGSGAFARAKPLANGVAPVAAGGEEGGEPRGPASYDKSVKDADVAAGLFTLIRKDGKVYVALRQDQFDKEFYEHATTANGLGGFGVLSGDDFEQPARIIKFERVTPKSVAIVLPQDRFDATPGTALESAVKASTAESVQTVAPIAAEDKASGRVVIDTSFLLRDSLDLANGLSEVVKNPENPMGAYHQDLERSYFGPSKAFPENVIIEAEQTYASEKPDTINTVSDPHSILMRVKYNFASIRSTPGYVPRLADDRVGFWEDPHLNFDRDDRYDNLARYIMRWDLQASDPSKPSPAKKPLVYTLTNTIPPEYRAAIREAILEWNKPFARIGILNAIQVQDQPSDPNWDPDDIRYNTIRWLTEANDGGFAEAQIEWDPRTGEIFRSGVLIDADIMRYGKFEYSALVDPASGSAPQADERSPDLPQPWDPAFITTLAPQRKSSAGFMHRDMGAKVQAAFGALALQLYGEAIPESYSHDFLKSIVLHEVGHDFGLAHNFIGYDAYSAEELKSKRFTDVYGVASSAMEYAPVNLWPRNASHGDYFQLVPGPYDYHVIHWGYAPVPGATTAESEVPTLDRWAQSATDPKYAFASDEDVEFNGHAVDPRIAQFMLTKDDISWCRSQLGIDSGLIEKLDTRFPHAQEPWDQERVALGMLLRQYGRCTQAMTHYVAGEHLSRARRGDPSVPLPLTPISRERERQAFATLDTYLFRDSAWRISPQTLRRTTYSEYEAFVDFGYKELPRHDLSLTEIVGFTQNRALGYMFAPLVLDRLADLPTKTEKHESTMSLADLFTWTQQSIYGDLAAGDPGVSTIHRNLQRTYARLLEHIAIAPQPGVPYDAQALARHELGDLLADLSRSERNATLDVQTRAHLEALTAEVRRSLTTHDVRDVDSGKAPERPAL
jgi:hypothetical protein